jgi:prephenate dehydratase
MLVFSREEAKADAAAGRWMTAFLFRVKSVPAALYKALGGFATNGVNIVKLESYLSGAQFEQAQFYAEVEGHPGQRSMQLALEELSFFSEEGGLKMLGTFPANPFRRKGWDAPTRAGT